jgi:catechol 2,3-dioxygenase-like lactoylglutathione lyase family enzyme
MRQQLHLITIGVKDLARSLEFYEQGLGWKRAQASGGDVVFFSLGGVVLSIYPRDRLAEDATVSQDGEGFEGITLAYNTRSKEEVDEVLRLAAGLGASIVKPAQDVFWGGYSGYFADPDGHLWEVAWNPFFKFDEDGKLNLP